ncbi:ATP-binding cassette domain-containing protein [Ekhidna sp.]|uniref:ABC transporter ATP-binding protein n=1 Tax=Ekhidna sp. TaxID=2608089 RepID=UPI0032984F9C
MTITGENIGKKYGRNWIFRDQDFEMNSGISTAITGKNGAGKSTLLQVIAGYLTPSKGEILVNDTKIDDSDHSSVFIGPYTEIIEEFTLEEFLNFHGKFKKARCNPKEMADSASLPLKKLIGEFSTGMKQRTKLITAFFYKNDVIFMDEPTSNLDEEGFIWWENNLEKLKNQILVIASNDKREIELCENRLDL